MKPGSGALCSLIALQKKKKGKKKEKEEESLVL